MSDHNVPYPAASDRKDLQDLVKSHWEDKVVAPYNSWDVNQLSSYLSSKGYEAKKGTEKTKDSLLSQMSSYWHETGDQANSQFEDVKAWIFDRYDTQHNSFVFA